VKTQRCALLAPRRAVKPIKGGDVIDEQQPLGPALRPAIAAATAAAAAS
jgi:hypothetical protein